MIRNLVKAAIQLLTTELNGTGLNFSEGPNQAPAVNQLPLVMLTPGQMEAPAPFGDSPAGQTRPRETVELFVVNIGNVAGPYTLAQQPLEGTLSCRLVWNQPGDPLEGKKIRLNPTQGPGDGFKIDYPNRKVEVIFASPLTGAPRLEVAYSFAAVFSIRDFRQILRLDCYAGSIADAEKWIALASSVLINNADALLKTANTTGNLNSAGNYATQHLVSTFVLQDGLPVRIAANMQSYQMQFMTTGQVILSRTLAGGAETIRKVFSPGHKNDPGTINIEPNIN